MNILFITPSLPSSLHRIRSLELLRYLGKNHSIHLVSLAEPQQAVDSEILKLCSSTTVVSKSLVTSYLSCLTFLPTRKPFEVTYCHSKAMKKEVKKIIQKEHIDIVYIKRLRSFQFVEGLKLNIPVVIDTTDAMSMFYERSKNAAPLWQKPMYWHEWLAYKRYERIVMSKVNHWIVCSDVDAKHLLNHKETTVYFHTVPNGIIGLDFKPSFVKTSGYAILFRGIMNKLVNIDAALFFVREIFNLIKTHIPLASLFIVGPQPSSCIKKLHDGKSIFVTGYVEDMYKMISESSVVVCPVRIGSGTRFKILQAWAMGKPVVSTTLGAEGLAVHNGDNILLADRPEDFAHAVNSILQSKNKYTHLGKKGRETFEKIYTMDVVGRKLERILETIVASKSHEKVSSIL